MIECQSNMRSWREEIQGSLFRTRHGGSEKMPSGPRKIAFVVDQRKFRRETSSKADKSGFAAETLGMIQRKYRGFELRFGQRLKERNEHRAWKWVPSI